MSFILLFSFPHPQPPSFLHTAYVSAALWYEQNQGLLVQQFQNDVMVSPTALMSKSVLQRKGGALAGTEGCATPKARSGLEGLLFWLAAQGAVPISMHRGHSYPHLP